MAKGDFTGRTPSFETTEAQAIADGLNQIRSNMDVSNNSHSLIEINELISSVAAQTNLIAMNAANITMEGITQVSQVTEEVKNAMQEQSIGSRQVFESMLGVDEITHEIRKNCCNKVKSKCK